MYRPVWLVVTSPEYHKAIQAIGGRGGRPFSKKKRKKK